MVISTQESQAGFTLIELMVTMSIAAILLAIAAPNFTAFQRNSELSSIANNFLAALNSARSEGMKRNMDGMLTPKDGDGAWKKGWIVFVDVDRSGSYNDGDILVMEHGALPNYITVSTNSTDPLGATASYARFDGSGFPKPKSGDLPTATLSFGRSDASADYSQMRRVILASTGRPRVCKPTSASDTSCRSSASN